MTPQSAQKQHTKDHKKECALVGNLPSFNFPQKIELLSKKGREKFNSEVKHSAQKFTAILATFKNQKVVSPLFSERELIGAVITAAYPDMPLYIPPLSEERLALAQLQTTTNKALLKRFASSETEENHKKEEPLNPLILSFVKEYAGAVLHLKKKDPLLHKELLQNLPGKLADHVISLKRELLVPEPYSAPFRATQSEVIFGMPGGETFPLRVQEAGKIAYLNEGPELLYQVMNQFAPHGTTAFGFHRVIIDLQSRKQVFYSSDNWIRDSIDTILRAGTTSSEELYLASTFSSSSEADIDLAFLPLIDFRDKPSKTTTSLFSTLSQAVKKDGYIITLCPCSIDEERAARNNVKEMLSTFNFTTSLIPYLSYRSPILSDYTAKDLLLSKEPLARQVQHLHNEQYLTRGLLIIGRKW